MKISEQWLREWVNPSLTRTGLCDKLTMAGLEVEAQLPVANIFSGVVAGQIIQIEKHPQADRLNICQVDIGEAALLNIVCGAANVRIGMKAPLAQVDAVLGKDFKIKRSKIRGIVSEGMLCSASELGLVAESEGLLELPSDTPLGVSIFEYLKLADYVIEISVTPNRGDCLSVMGLAKEVAALTQTSFTPPSFIEVTPSIKDKLSVIISAAADCPSYTGRIIRGIKTDAVSPIWLQERLRRAGMRCIYPVVDVMNYVMLELGQPMHAFDLEKIQGQIQVRMAKESEELKLLDGQMLKLDSDTLIVADENAPLAIAGVMGGLESGVSTRTQDIFLESVVFSPAAIIRTTRKYGLSSESSYRFERGVDPALQTLAIERATELLLEITGGQAGPIINAAYPNELPKPAKILLRLNKITALLGLTIPASEIEVILKNLDCITEKNSEGWQVIAPLRRFDLKLEVDLIEEIARMYRYEKIPLHHFSAALQSHPVPEEKISVYEFKRVFADLGYHEAITYSFVDRKQQNLFDPDQVPKELINPLTLDMAVMRTSLWPGLMNVLLYNVNRQQARVRLFEIGLRFLVEGESILQQKVISGLVSGLAAPEQWGVPSVEADFFDLKGDLENVFQLTGASHEFEFKPAAHPALHPGKSAEIYRAGKYIGIVGAMHPALQQEYGVTEPVFLFELLLDPLQTASIPRFKEISKFPEIRRDIAIFVDRTIPSALIQDTIAGIAGEWLKGITVFDVYQGKGVAPQQKSIAISLTLQHFSRTLLDQEVADLMERVIVVLKQKFAAELRG